MDTLLSMTAGRRRSSLGGGKVTNEDIMKKLEGLVEQNSELKDMLSERRTSNSGDTQLAEENILKQQKLTEQSEMLKRLEEILREKEQQMGKLVKSQNEKIRILEQNKQEFNMLRQSLNGLKAAGTNFYGARAAVEGWKSKFFKRLSFYLDSGFSCALQIIF